MTIRRRVLAASGILALGLGATACGSEGVHLDKGARPNVKAGANLFAERCAGCHTLDVAGTQGGATQIHDRERTDGPNFNVRHETMDGILYAIRNGGFSGAIMPENIVVGQQARDVAAFLSKYAGRESPATVESPPGPPPSQTTTGTSTTPAASTPSATTSTPSGTTSTPASGAQAAAQGKQLFTANCASCHTLKNAGAKGTVGPNLDNLKPSEAIVDKQVTNGGAVMPAFKGQLSPAQIKAVATYVSSVAGK